MKKLCVAALTLTVCLTLLVSTAAAAGQEVGYTPRAAMATNNTIVVSNSADTPDAHVVRPAVYKIEGDNYFRLRDLAMLLRGSAREFAVDYDEAAKAVSITSGRPYVPIGGELSGTAAGYGSAVPTNNAVRIDGESASLTVFKIGGDNYFRLRDLGRALDFYVGYDEHTKIVYISGAKGYDWANDPDGVPFAAQYVRTNGYRDGVSYPVVTLIDSAAVLRRYYEANRALYDFSHKETVYSDTTVGFVDAIAGYDEAWFETHQLLLVLLEEGSGSVRHTVTKVTARPAASINIDRLIPEVGTDDMAEWHILIETDRLFDAGKEIEVRLTAKPRA